MYETFLFLFFFVFSFSQGIVMQANMKGVSEENVWEIRYSSYCFPFPLGTVRSDVESVGGDPFSRCSIFHID